MAPSRPYADAGSRLIRAANAKRVVYNSSPHQPVKGRLFCASARAAVYRHRKAIPREGGRVGW